MKAQGSSDAAVVEFVGRVQRMARIHQEGRDKLNRFSRAVKYDSRPLLGFSASDKDIVEEVVTEFFREWLVSFAKWKIQPAGNESMSLRRADFGVVLSVCVPNISLKLMQANWNLVCILLSQKIFKD